MADLDQSSGGLHRSHIQLPHGVGVGGGGGTAGPQVLRPAPNRHFPLPSSAATFPVFNQANAAAAAAVAAAISPEKSKIAPFGSPATVLKPVTKVEANVNESLQGATEQGHKEESKTNVLTDVSSSDVKRQKNRKPAKQKRSMQQEIGSVDGIPLDPLNPGNCRYDSSLSLLTKKFVTLLQQTEDGTLDLNKAAEILEVQKRRIYDITNVLEGVGLLEKSLKNRIRWKGDDVLGPMDLESEVAALKVTNETLFKEECRLDKMIREMEENVRVLTEERHHKLLYLTKEDTNSLRCFQNSTLIAIKAPRGTSIEVPDPDEGFDFPQKRYHMFLRSSMGPINCFLLSNHEKGAETPNLDHQHIPMDVDLSTENNRSNRDNASCSRLESQDDATMPQLQVQEIPNISSDHLIEREGLVRIVPPDSDANDDYWFQPDQRGSVTDIWSICLQFCALMPKKDIVIPLPMKYRMIFFNEGLQNEDPG